MNKSTKNFLKLAGGALFVKAAFVLAGKDGSASVADPDHAVGNIAQASHNMSAAPKDLDAQLAEEHYTLS